GHVIASYYIESALPVAQLSAQLAQLDTTWLLSSLMARQIIDMWRFEDQAERFRLTEKALWANETYLNAILRYSPALIAVKDLNGNVIMASDHYKQLANIGDESMVGKNAYDIYPPALAESLRSMDAAAVGAHKAFETELELLHKDGSLHTYLMVR